jgi:hypothetical protein
MRNEFNISTISDMLQAINIFNDIHACQNYTLIKPEHAINFKKISYEMWLSYNIHIVSQTWENTSGGWQSIGGAAMTTQFTIIIEHIFSNSVWVFYSGKLAYICTMDSLYNKYKGQLEHLPGKSNAIKNLTLINV